ncbi:hypothetical protein AX777_23420 [Sphingobium yanoikuyae]|uniref:Uncharacterized protein n=1 Tax=Sphingobium yanoikuyae TaxID=13690 RepID=A0A177JCG2_SPHYA|nr:hypothetical protein AX777_23420 [Sphingobium yanoikuyae]
MRFIGGISLIVCEAGQNALACSARINEFYELRPILKLPRFQTGKAGIVRKVLAFMGQKTDPEVLAFQVVGGDNDI